MTAMQPHVRPARPDDAAVPELLYISAAPYYDAFAGDAGKARALLRALYPLGGHAAAYDACHVAELEGSVVGVMACFASDEGDRIARRFLRLAFLRIAPWRWPRTLRHLRAASAVSPIPPPDALYVDALAVAGQARRRGVARALLDHAAGLARERGCHAVSLDTGIDNQDARLLYEACGFRFRTQRVAPDTRTERAVGGRGFVSYEKHV